MSDTSNPIQVLILTGPVGVGKTSVAWEISEILENNNTPHTFLDADFCYIYPRSEDDSRGVNLYIKNLKSILSNINKINKSKILLTKVIESKEDLSKIKKAIPNSVIKIIRLNSPLKIISERLIKREIGSGYKWHMQRVTKFLEIWENNIIDDHLIIENSLDVKKTAQEILTILKWI